MTIKLGSPKTKHLPLKEIADKMLRNLKIKKTITRIASQLENSKTNVDGYQPLNHSNEIISPPKKP